MFISAKITINLEVRKVFIQKKNEIFCFFLKLKYICRKIRKQAKDNV